MPGNSLITSDTDVFKHEAHLENDYHSLEMEELISPFQFWKSQRSTKCHYEFAEVKMHSTAW